MPSRETGDSTGDWRKGRSEGMESRKDRTTEYRTVLVFRSLPSCTSGSVLLEGAENNMWALGSHRTEREVRNFNCIKGGLGEI